MLIEFIFCGFLFGVPLSTAGVNVIHVNSSDESSSCVKIFSNDEREELVCPTLNLALQAITQFSTIYLYPMDDDVYILEPGNETMVWNRSAINIIGYSAMIDKASTTITINCQNRTGLSFFHTNNIVLESVEFKNCSGTQISTSRNFYSSKVEYLSYTVAVFMKHCINVTLLRVTVSYADGVGVTMYNTVGTVSVINSIFKNNENKQEISPRLPGGGGLQIELSDTHVAAGSEESTLYLSGANYTISGSEFGYNSAHYRQSVIIISSSFSPGLTNDEFNLGKGGGFSILLRGRAANNSFTIRNCLVYHNKAHWGGGFYVSFQESSSNNTVQLIDSKIERNENFDVELWSGKREFDIDGGGGGGKILYSSSDNMRDNTMIINSCTFENNNGVTGGGLWVESVIGLHSNGTYFKIIDSHFLNGNKAFLGSAIYFSGQFMKGTAPGMIKDTDFKENYSLCGRLGSQGYAYLPCAGILYAINFPLTFKGKVLFQRNNATALEIHEGSLDIGNWSELIFVENTSQYGGALALYDCSFMTIWPNTSLVFIHNHADVLGGAIYSASCSGAGQPAAVSFRCFIQYSYLFVHPNQWKTTLNFDKNTEGINKNMNDMYVTSLPACWWPKIGSNVITQEDYKDTFCWKPWNFTENCNTSFHSSPSFISFFDAGDETFIKLYPGENLPLPIVYDGAFRETNNLTSGGFIACVLSGTGSFSSDEIETCRTAHNAFQLFWPKQEKFVKDDEIVLISMQVNQKIGYGATIYVQYQNCQWPLYFNQSQCLYSDEYFTCNTSVCGISSLVTPKPEFCLTAENLETENKLVVGLCPPMYSNRPLISWHNDAIVFNTSSCSYNQSGRLCGGCAEGYAVPLNSLHYLCYECDTNSLMFGWLMFILLQILPLLTFVVLIFVFGIDLNNGTMTGFVFYWQMISLNCPAWYYPAWFSFPTTRSLHGDIVYSSMMARIATFLYSITNLNFLVIYEPVTVFPICVSQSMDTLSVIAFWYIVPVIAILLTVVITVWLALYDRGYYCIVKVSIPFHKLIAKFWRKFNINETSLFKSIGSVYILCFTQIGSTSFQILHFASWHSLDDKNRTGKVFFYDGNLDYFGSHHAPFAIIALCMLFFLALLPMVFIIMYPSKSFHRFVLNKVKHTNVNNTLKTFGDTFTGCYKSSSPDQRMDYRYFAGLMLFLRIVVLFFYYIPGQYSDIILYLESAIMLLLAGAIMIFRPFRTEPFAINANYLNFCLLILLGMMTILSLIFGPEATLINLIGTIHIPTLLIVIHVIWRVIRYTWNKLRKKFKDRKNIRYEQVPLSDDDGVMDNLADRVENPDEYSNAGDFNNSREFKWLSSMSDYKSPKATSTTTDNTRSTIDSQDAAAVSLPTDPQY